MKRLKLFIPLIVFAVLAVFLWKGLGNDPSHLPSVLVGKPLPEFSLPTVEDPDRTVTRADIVQGKPFLINVWATWCVACRVEHPYLLELSKQGVLIYGLDYRDDRAEAQKWLTDFKNPYAINLFDPEGRLVLDLGVYGAPETFLVDAEGVIQYRHVGVVDEKVWQSKLAPLYHGQ